jgi:stringent starvation protein B
MGSPDRPSKQDAFLALLAEGCLLHLDARRDGVVVPAHLKGEAHLVLQYGNDLPIPIPDLQIDENGVSATLSFARTPWPTVVPWTAVYVVTSPDGRGVLYQEDVPGDVSVIAAGARDDAAGEAAKGSNVATAAAGAASPGGRAPSPTPRALRAVPSTGPVDDFEGVAFGSMVNQGGAAGEALSPARRRKRPQLRLVK